MEVAGTKRLPAASTQVFCSCRGQDGTQVAVGTTGKQVEMSSGNFKFNLAADFTIDFTACIEFYYKVSSVQNSTAYTITVDTTDYTYTSDTDATEAEILAGLVNAVNAGSQNVTAEQVGTEVRVYSDDFTTTFAFSAATANVGLVKGGVRAEFTAVDAGPLAVIAGQVDTIVTPVIGWDEVINLVPGTTGRYVETDDELRVRREDNIASSRGGTELGMQNALYDQVDGILRAIVTSNRTDATDANGIPPHRVLSIVQGGSDQDIVDALFPALGAGILPYGNTSATHIDQNLSLIHI